MKKTPNTRRSTVPTKFLLPIAIATSVAMVGLTGCNRSGGKPAAGTTSTTTAAGGAAAAEKARTESLRQVRDLITANKMDEAHELIDKHLVEHPEDPQAMVLAAQTNSARGELDESLKLLDEATELWTENRQELNIRAADLLLEAGRWQDAVERLETLLESHPNYHRARHALIAILNSKGFRFDANEQVRVLCRNGGGATAEELRGLISPTRAFITFTEKPDPSDPATLEKYGVLSTARALFGEGDVRDAVTALEGSELIEQKNPAALAFYGQVLVESQQFDKFKQWLGDAGSELERYPAYWMAMGGWALEQRQNDAAVRMFGEAIVREPGDIGAYNRMAQALAAAGQDEAAKQFTERSEQLNLITQLTQKILTSPDANAEMVNDLTDRLSKVERPFESLAWHEMALMQFGVAQQAPGAGEAAMFEVYDTRQQLLKAEEEQPEEMRKKLLCGIELDDFPLDRSWVEASSSSGSDPAPADQSFLKPAEPVFDNVAAQVGLDFRYRNAPEPVEREFRIFQAYGAGVACCDYDRDGRVDLYVGQAAGEPPDGLGKLPNLLARNLGDRFQGVTDPAGCDDRNYTCGVTAGDWNQDGFDDLVVGNMQRNRLLINQGDGTFREQGGDGVWNEPKYTASLAMADVDGDHLPDIVEVNYLDDSRIYEPIARRPDGTPIRLPGPLHFRPAADRLFRSMGDGTMTGQMMGNPDQPAPANGLGVLVTDIIPGSGGNEVFVANDLMANQLWEHDKDSFVDRAVVRGVAYGRGGMPMACMGIAAADFDGNGRLDMHITNFEDQWSNQYMQNDEGFFTDLVLPYGLDVLSLKMLGFGTQAFDYDNNATIDLVVGNGHIEDHTARGSAFEMPTQIFAGQGSTFVDMQVSGDGGYWASNHLARGLATCDWNNDGRLDFVVTDLKQPLALLENRTETDHHWLQIELVGTTSERDAIGAAVTVTVGGQQVTRSVQTGDGYMSRNQSLLAFGLGGHDHAENAEIDWPDGNRQAVGKLAANRRHLIVQGQPTTFVR